MNGLLEHRLSKEDSDVRRLVWILQMKKPSLKNSVTRETLNQERDKQIIILKKKGVGFKELSLITSTYNCGLELVI